MGTFTNAAVAAILFGAAFFSAAASAQPFMHTGGVSTQPVGHYEFCQRMPAECRSNGSVRAPAELTRAAWASLVEVNNLANLTVTPRTDREMWGVEELWSYPVDGVGDCEDYVLEKRRRLIEIGFSPSDLLVTVVRQSNGEGHAVLVVHTSMGDFVLDNLETRVLRWTETGYTFLKRQAREHSGKWVTINDDRNMLVGSISGQ